MTAAQATTDPLTPDEKQQQLRDAVGEAYGIARYSTAALDAYAEFIALRAVAEARACLGHPNDRQPTSISKAHVDLDDHLVMTEDLIYHRCDCRKAQAALDALLQTERKEVRREDLTDDPMDAAMEERFNNTMQRIADTLKEQQKEAPDDRTD